MHRIVWDGKKIKDRILKSHLELASKTGMVGSVVPDNVLNTFPNNMSEPYSHNISCKSHLNQIEEEEGDDVEDDDSFFYEDDEEEDYEESEDFEEDLEDDLDFEDDLDDEDDEYSEDEDEI